jgi:chromate reductase
VLGLCSSLRAASYNLAALHAAAELMPAGRTLQMATLHGLPVYDADEQAQGWPPAVLGP